MKKQLSPFITFLTGFIISNLIVNAVIAIAGMGFIMGPPGEYYSMEYPLGIKHCTRNSIKTNDPLMPVYDCEYSIVRILINIVIFVVIYLGFLTITRKHHKASLLKSIILSIFIILIIKIGLGLLNLTRIPDPEITITEP